MKTTTTAAPAAGFPRGARPAAPVVGVGVSRPAGPAMYATITGSASKRSLFQHPLAQHRLAQYAGIKSHTANAGWPPGPRDRTSD